VICFGCGEKNPDSYRFCGMCGGPLQAAKPSSGSDPARAAEPPPEQSSPPAPESRSENFPFSRAERLAKVAPSERVPPISGPSMLGLNEPSLDSLREKAFSSADETYFEPEARGPAWKRIFMTLVILGALGGAAWWAYTNYAQPGASTPPDSGAKQDAAANIPAASVPEKKEAPAPPVAVSAPTESAPAADTKKTAEPANENESASADNTKAEPDKTIEKPQPPHEAPAVVVKPAAKAAARKVDTGTEKAVKTPPAVVPAEGEALFRRGEAYLYGRGVAANCDQAIKYLKSASDKSHAKARSAFGTMYATGHCVPRDLPTSYRWFALALRIDPNNQILEKDLSAVWNQMTPPERQLATKPSQ
jgi:hypothetical protein